MDFNNQLSMCDAAALPLSAPQRQTPAADDTDGCTWHSPPNAFRHATPERHKRTKMRERKGVLTSSAVQVHAQRFSGVVATYILNQLTVIRGYHT